jgi:hypothetical protein
MHGRNKKIPLRIHMSTLILLILFGGSFFFNSQSDIISSSKNEDIMLKTPFHWSQNMPNESEETNIVEVQQESEGVIQFTRAEET